MKTQKGFTLIELAIVLVIIGLLLGGVLKGQELITQAKIKNVISDFSGTTVAYYGYQDRYKAIPGDDSGAIARWTLATGEQGNGNGTLTGGYADNGGTTPSETSLFWLHLRRSGLISGSGTSNPLNAFSGMLGVQDGGDSFKSTGTTAGTGFTGPIICAANIPDKAASAIDSQLDDGNPQTGTVRAVVQTAANPAITATTKNTDATYVETGGQQYLVCKSL